MNSPFTRPMYYRRDGTPCKDALEWASDFKRLNRRVAETTLGRVRIATVWLGIDHSLGMGTGPIQIFETMVFKPDNFRDLDCARYATESEALEGHQLMVEKWKAKEVDFDFDD